MNCLKISVLGSTGSIGRQTLDVCRWFPERLQISALAAGSNWRLLAEQVREFRPRLATLADVSHYAEFKQAITGIPTEILVGGDAAIAAAEIAEAGLAVAAMPGLAGLKPALAAINAGKQLALANKEVLVAAGELAVKLARQKGVQLLPVDSEHSAIYQCLRGEPKPEGLILTASGGPFRNRRLSELGTVTAEQALQHPVWNMGRKVTIDSASLANKGLEVMEARWLFDIDYDSIEVLVHPQSVVHSLVRFADGSVKAQLGLADMRLPIQYALLGPERPANTTQRLDLAAVGNLTFEQPDAERFPALKLAYQAGRTGGSYPTAYNAANEVLGAAFADGQIPFTAIGAGLETALVEHKPQPIANLDDILAVDAQTRALTDTFIKGFKTATF